ncbi:MAG: hypothetical protein BGO08_03530 [Altererythrobacter sp. 66-12]|nr:MAG: hypothetical protein BGO08_03530 [Altererythrobacter sp. 66-12]
MQHGVSQPVQVRIAPAITCRIGMGVAVYFDDQPGGWTEEIYDRPADHLLTAEFEGTGELGIREMPPKTLLGFGRIDAHRAGALMKLRDPLSRQAPPLAPPLKGRGIRTPALIGAFEIHAAFLAFGL